MEDKYQWVEVHEKSRGRNWQNVGPLTLIFLGTKLEEQHPHLPPLTAENARQICGLPERLSLQLCCE